MRRWICFFLVATAAVAADGNGSRLEIGFEQRVRNENWNNILDFSSAADDEREQIRYRTRAWARLRLRSDIDVAVGLNQETNQKLSKVNRFDEVIFDTAYIEFKRLPWKGLSLKVGRQNITKGEGFLFFEGNPGDGSRAIYFNAADLAYTYRKSTIELIGIVNPRTDRFLPRIHDQHKVLQNWDEQALGIYYTNNERKSRTVEAYAFRKREVKDILPAANPRHRCDRRIDTAGGRIVQRFGQGWSATAELAVEHGRREGSAAIGAAGGYGYLKKEFQRTAKPYVQFGYWGMSGDFDPLFSRWPKWSELYIYSQVPEVDVGYWTNIGMWQAEAGAAPRKWLSFRATCYRMNAYEPHAGPASVFGTGTGRGNNYQARVDFTPHPAWRAHALYERVTPGDFYSYRDPGYFLRFEVSWLARWTGALNQE